jgi:anion-transporting  ArsA/GET3 family ATPase
MAFTGKKTLSYKDAQRAGESTSNYSSNAAAQELTSLLQNLSATLEFGHRLDYYRRYQKLALDEELKRMQEMAKDNLLVEMSAIHPILEQIAADQAVVNIARARAQRLMDGVGGR